MEKKINIAELLKNCPKGMELDCVMFENVVFNAITDNNIFPICIKRIDGHPVILTKHGGYANCPSSKCVIFPKGKTTWEGFVPPCKFKDGDIIFTHADCLKVGVGNTWISIFKEKRNGGVATYVDYAEDGSDYYSDLDGDKALLCMESDILRQRFATEEEKEKLFKAIKDRGYRWDDKTKILEKLTKSYKEETKNNAIFDYNAQCCDIMNDIIKKDMKEIKINIPAGYEFAGVDDNAQQAVFAKIQPEYPKTYEECCKILGVPSNFELRNQTIQAWYIVRLSFFQQLLICLNAYWEIVGRQMRLGKPWEPDWEDETEIYHTISYDGVNIKCYNNTDVYSKLAFPTEEMRDAFYENFKELINQCKELL